MDKSTAKRVDALLKLYGATKVFVAPPPEPSKAEFVKYPAMAMIESMDIIIGGKIYPASIEEDMELREKWLESNKK